MKRINLASRAYWVITSRKGRWDWVRDEREGFSPPRIEFSQPIEPGAPGRLPQIYTVEQMSHPTYMATLRLQSLSLNYEFSSAGFQKPFLFWKEALERTLPFTERNALEYEGSFPEAKPAAHQSTQIPPSPQKF